MGRAHYVRNAIRNGVFSHRQGVLQSSWAVVEAE
jgi:hypothetical protein